VFLETNSDGRQTAELRCEADCIPRIFQAVLLNGIENKYFNTLYCL